MGPFFNCNGPNLSYLGYFSRVDSEDSPGARPPAAAAGRRSDVGSAPLTCSRNVGFWRDLNSSPYPLPANANKCENDREARLNDLGTSIRHSTRVAHSNTRRRLSLSLSLAWGREELDLCGSLDGGGLGRALDGAGGGAETLGDHPVVNAPVKGNRTLRRR